MTAQKNTVDVERLLEKKWADLRHIETERNWFLVDYGVVVAASFTFLGNNSNMNFNIEETKNFILFLLSGFSLTAVIHTLRAQWQLMTIQNHIISLVAEWRLLTNQEHLSLVRYWTYDRDRNEPSSDWYKLFIGLTPLVN